MLHKVMLSCATFSRAARRERKTLIDIVIVIVHFTSPPFFELKHLYPTKREVLGEWKAFEASGPRRPRSDSERSRKVFRYA